MTETSATSQRSVACEIPGCTRRIEYSGVGRRPKYCGATIDGIDHTRLTAYRLAHGQAPAGGGGDRAGSPEQPDGGVSRPVTVARLSLEDLLTRIRETVAGHEVTMGALAAQVAQAAATAADPDAAATEITGAHREARAAIDAADTERDVALAQARDAERAAAADEQRRRSAEDAAEDALAEVETAQTERDQARAASERASEAADRAQGELAVATTEWGRTTERLDAVSTELAQAREQLGVLRGDLAQARDTIAATRQEAVDLAAARDGLAGELVAERERTVEQRRRAEDAEREASRAQGSVEQLRGELATAREAGDRAQGEVLRVGTELATATAQLAAAREQVAAEKAHAGERVADQRQRTEAAERDAQQLRAALDEQRVRHNEELAALRTTTPQQPPTTGPRKPTRGRD